MPKPLTAIMIGAGNRGYEAYGPYAQAHPDEIQFISVAEPVDARRQRFSQAHNIPQAKQFNTWEELIAQGQIADVALVTTMDRQHLAPATAAMEAGYHVLLEKPMAAVQSDCVNLVQTAEKTGRILQICHVLRYTTFFSSLHEIISSNRLGEIITVEHRENLTYWHMAHSFVRGHWRSSQVESPMILAKCCHDMDILFWNLGRCRKLSSFGSLRHFRPDKAPPGAPKRCTDGCQAADDCPWYAPRLYQELTPLFHVARNSNLPWERWGASILLDQPNLALLLRRLIPPFEHIADYRGWPISVISDDTSINARQTALETGPWGRCVYQCDNDVVDHQVVSMEMESGATVSFTMQGFSHLESRTMRYEGTHATLRGIFANGRGDSIEIHDHRTGRMEKLNLTSQSGGHGGGDEGIMSAFVSSVRDQGAALTNARQSLESHLMAFAAEQARIENSVVEIASYREQAEARS